MSICRLCKRKDIHKKRRKSGRIQGARGLCGVCIVTLQRIRQRVAAINLLGGKCVVCGWQGNIHGYDIHHLYDKDFSIGSSYAREWTVVKEELKKCVLLCVFCHRSFHSYANKLDITDIVYDYVGQLPMGERKPELFTPVSGFPSRSSYLETRDVLPHHIATKIAERMRNRRNRPQCAIPTCRNKIGEFQEKYCSSRCQHIALRVATWPTKKQLQELARNNSVQAIGRMFGVSGNAVRKWAKNMGFTLRSVRKA